MTIVVIGGQSRNVGKTSVVAGLIAALPQYRWSAFKISQHRHGADAPWSVCEELDSAGTGDTARFLQAGATRAWLVRAEPGRLGEAMPALRQKIAEAENAIIESNSVLEFLSPDLFLMVVDSAVEDCKASARRFVHRADGLIVHGRDVPAWVGSRGPVFLMQKPRYVTPEMVRFIEEKLRR
jgi:hypothetical protein